MSLYISSNLKIIKKHYKKRLKNLSNPNSLSFKEEFKEWNDDSFDGNEKVWSLPDLTRKERLINFCRSIKKEIH